MQENSQRVTLGYASVINRQTYVHAAKTPRDFLPRNPISATRKYQANGILKNI